VVEEHILKRASSEQHKDEEGPCWRLIVVSKFV
jgi:hypothetical protein